MSKFAKKGHLVVDADNAKMAKVGDTDKKSRGILKKANIEEAPEKAEKPAKLVKNAKPEAKAKGKAPKAEPKEKAADTRKIKLLVKENPKREGTSSYDRFELYKGAKTVADFIEAGGTAADVKYDEGKGYIQVG